MSTVYQYVLKNPYLIKELVEVVELFPFVEVIKIYNMSCDGFSIGSWRIKINNQTSINVFINAIHINQWKVQINKDYISIYDPNRGWVDLTNDEWVNIYKIYLNPELLNFL